MAVRTKQLASGRVSTSTSTVIYTVPAGETAIVKSIWLQNLSASTPTIAILTADAGAFDKTTLHRFDLDILQGTWVDSWIVFPPGAEIALSSTANVGVNFWLSGTELEGVAD